MPLILNIESATTACSVALSCDGEILSLRERNEGYSHAENLTVFCEEVMKEAGKSFSDLDAIAVSKGPGSYTGLRIGVSAAKGFAFALSKPLISVPTLKALTYHLLRNLPAHLNTGQRAYIPMLDARRMEVYCAGYNLELKELLPVQAHILTENSFSELRKDHSLVLFGDGAGKAKDVLQGEDVLIFGNIFPSASAMIHFSEEAFSQKHFEDVAYFEPYYLKDFITGQKKTHDKV